MRSRVQVVDSSVIIRATTTRDVAERARLQDLIADSPIVIAHVYDTIIFHWDFAALHQRSEFLERDEGESYRRMGLST